MIFNQILQSTIDGLRSISGFDIYIMDPEGTLLCSTDPVRGGISGALVPEFVSGLEDSAQLGAYQYFKVSDNSELVYVAAVKGSSEEATKLGRIVVFTLQNLLVAYREKYDKDNFIKNLLLDNLLLVDIYTRAKKLHIDNNISRVVYLIESKNDNETNSSIMDVVRSIYPVKTRDFITAVDENSIILVKDVSEDNSRESVEAIAETIHSMLSSEAMGKVRIALGSVVTDLKDISRSYKDAKIALDVGKIFYEDKYVINYNRLGIGRLIYQLPMELCQMYLQEIFKDIKVEDFDEETLYTVNKFFENSLNISETSRQLYIHRNTLVYRLDKLQKNTGLDIRTFDDAITFKIALMVAKYMKYMQNNNGY